MKVNNYPVKTPEAGDKLFGSDANGDQSQFEMSNFQGLTYKVYTALITQSGITDPTISELDNTVGNIVWTRTAVGQYDGVLVGAFPTASKVYAMVQSFNIYSAHVSIYNPDSDTIQISTVDNTYSPIDGVLLNASIEIRVYN